MGLQRLSGGFFDDRLASVLSRHSVGKLGVYLENLFLEVRSKMPEPWRKLSKCKNQKHRLAADHRHEDMKVVVHGLQNQTQFNGAIGRVLSVQRETQLRIYVLASDSYLIARAENLKPVLSRVDDDVPVRIFEFPENTAEEELDQFLSRYRESLGDTTGAKQEVVFLRRPEHAASYVLMGPISKGGLIFSARLEHRGKLSPAAAMLGWEAHLTEGTVVYKNHALAAATPCTRYWYMNPERMF